jgi:acetyl-CoA carboxylase biotin carboxyl carrier protein
MDLSHDDVAQILRLIDEGQFEELHLETDTIKLHVSRRASGRTDSGSPAARMSVGTDVDEGATGAGATPTDATSAPVAAPAPSVLEDGQVPIQAPLLGIFYRAPKPGAAPFVEVGSPVEPDTTVCIIEVMKLMHSVPAGVMGCIASVCADDGSLVEYKQGLFIVQLEQ